MHNLRARRNSYSLCPASVDSGAYRWVWLYLIVKAGVQQPQSLVGVAQLA